MVCLVKRWNRSETSHLHEVNCSETLGLWLKLEWSIAVINTSEIIWRNEMEIVSVSPLSPRERDSSRNWRSCFHKDLSDNGASRATGISPTQNTVINTQHPGAQILSTQYPCQCPWGQAGKERSLVDQRSNGGAWRAKIALWKCVKHSGAGVGEILSSC